MKISYVLAVAVLVAFGASAVPAQQDPIAARKALMKANGKGAEALAKMVKGEAPFDQATAQKAFDSFQDAAAKMPDLFPENSKTGGETAALPRIWENMADVKARFAKLGDDSKAAAASVKDLGSLKAAFSNVGRNCSGCHEMYRLKKT